MSRSKREIFTRPTESMRSFCENFLPIAPPPTGFQKGWPIKGKGVCGAGILKETATTNKGFLKHQCQIPNDKSFNSISIFCLYSTFILFGTYCSIANFISPYCLFDDY